MPTRSPHVIDVDRDRLHEAAAVLARAFADDPLMRYLLADHGPTYHARLRDIFYYQCELQLQSGLPLLGVVPRTRLAGVVGVTLPEQVELPEAVVRLYEDLTARLGAEATARLERYANRTEGHFPDVPMCYVRMIGVRPESQGQGYARILLDTVQRRSEAHPTSTGVALDTENPSNVPIYERLGYEVVGKARIDQIAIWCLFRPNGKNTESSLHKD